MIHIDNGEYRLEDESIVRLAADLTIALEIIGCAGILEQGDKEMGKAIINSICDKAKEDLREPSETIWEQAKNLMIEIIRRGRYDQG